MNGWVWSSPREDPATGRPEAVVSVATCSVARSHCGTAQAGGWVVETSGASLPLARVAWLGFVCRGEPPEILDLFLQLDNLELTPNSQPVELL